MRSRLITVTSLATLLTLGLALGCAEFDSDIITGDAGTDSDTDIDTDIDSDTDSDLDTDADTDNDSNNDSDNDSDNDTDNDSDSDTDTDSDATSDVLSAEIEYPLQGDFVEQGESFTFSGTVSSQNYPAEELEVQWISTIDGQVGTSTPNSTGAVTLTIDTLTPGWHWMRLRVINPAEQLTEDSIYVGVCIMTEPESFDLDIEGSAWKIYGDAYWVDKGWLEMTGKNQGMEGQIFNVSEPIPPDDVKISFDLRTGGGFNNGADGFAMSIIDAEDQTHLEAIIDDMFHGGGLGYAYNAKPGTWDVPGFHIEFDTWWNDSIWNQDTGDPTTANHIAVHLNGNPRDPVWWKALNVEDSQWHTVTIEITGELLIVTLDGTEEVNETFSELDFRGGYIGFSGSTGEATNLHSFDNLAFLDQCIVPEG